MKRLTQALLGLLLACGVCAEVQAEGQYHGDLAQPPSIREVVVWVNEKGEPIGTETNLVQPPTPTPPVNPSLPQQVSNSNPDTDTLPPAISKKDTELNDSPSPVKDTKKEAHQHDHDHPDPPVPHPHPAHPHPDHPHPDHPHPGHPHPGHPHPGHPHPGHPHHPHPGHPHHPHPDHPGPPPHPPHSHPDAHDQFGISYSPYKADRTCKNQEEVNHDLDRLSEHSFIRIYGTDCDQTKTVTNAARRHNMRVFAGVYDLTDFPDSLKAFGEALDGPEGQKDWSIFHTIAVGNELVNAGTNSPGDVVDAVNKARSVLRSQGYKGPVVTVDTFSVLLDHPELCHASDYCAANCHAFFDANQKPGGAGAYALEQARAISSAAGGKRTMITESGWPHAGDPNGDAIPSPENQETAMASLRKSFDHRRGDLVLFTAFDDLWKDDNSFTFSAEKFWGIHGDL